jgi:hypothetical protein
MQLISGMPPPWISFSGACLQPLRVPMHACIVPCSCSAAPCAFANRSAETKICYSLQPYSPGTSSTEFVPVVHGTGATSTAVLNTKHYGGF